jgi:hypothetical protein
MLSDINPLAKSCLKIESSLAFSGADVSTLKQYSSASSLLKNKWYMALLIFYECPTLEGGLENEMVTGFR